MLYRDVAMVPTSPYLFWSDAEGQPENMSIEVTRSFLLWCTVINYGNTVVAMYSCQNPSAPLANTIARINAASVGSCKNSDTIAASIK